VSKQAAEGKEQPYDRKLLAAVCEQLLQPDLTEVLKYPFCTGEAEQIVLNQLGAKTGQDFAGNVWNFVEQADALGIKNIDSPASRPSAQDALNELSQALDFVDLAIGKAARFRKARGRVRVTETRPTCPRTTSPTTAASSASSTAPTREVVPVTDVAAKGEIGVKLAIA
jgi:hypothetical protein